MFLLRPRESFQEKATGAVHAGAALAAVDAALAAAAAHTGAWAQRLAVMAAAAGLARLGRPEDEDAVRDLLALGDMPPVGPAAPVTGAYVWLAGGPLVGRAAAIPDLVADLGARSGTASDDLARALVAAVGRRCPLDAARAAAGAMIAARPGRDALILWAADVALCGSLEWTVGLPLLSLGLRPGQPAAALLDDGEGEGRLAAAIVRGALRAVDHFAELGRRAAALQAVRSRLRARAAGRVVERLLDRDAVSVAGVRDVIPERAARRLFDRLVALGAVRELSGRPMSRLYGL